MHARTVLLFLLMIVATPLSARNKTDVLVMNNGDRMTCEVKGLDGGVLFVSFDYIDGTTSVDWSKVARLESTQLFVVKVADGSVYTGKIKTPATAAEQPVQIQVLESPELQPLIERGQIVQMIATSDKVWQRF